MSTIVGTNIEVTNLKYDSDTTSMIISNTGQVTIQGENTNTTNLQQGLAKCWLRMSGDNTPAINDSLNITSITDLATGNYRVTIANDMGNANYAATTGAGGASSNNTLMNCSTPGDALGAGTIDLDLQYAHATPNDPRVISFAIFGDLS